MHNKSNIKFNPNQNLIILLSIVFLYLTYNYNLYKFPDAVNGPLMPWDGDRYLRPKNFSELIGAEYFKSFPIYFLFVSLFKKLSLLHYLPFFQFLIFFFSCFFFFKRISKNSGSLIALISWLLIICNPIFFRWCHAVNPLIITLSLSILSLSILLSKNNKILLTFIILLLLLKNDAKLILNYIILNYFFLRKIINSNNKKKFIFILLITLVISTDHLMTLSSSTSSGFIFFSESYNGTDIIRHGAQLKYYDISTLQKCTITEMNSLINHFCSIKNNPLYILELYSKRLLYGFFWISPSWSLQFQILSKLMLSFYYFFTLIGYMKTENRNFLIFNFFAPFVLTLPYILDGDQRFVTHAYIFLIPLAANGFYFFTEKIICNLKKL